MKMGASYPLHCLPHASASSEECAQGVQFLSMPIGASVPRTKREYVENVCAYVFGACLLVSGCEVVRVCACVCP